MNVPTLFPLAKSQKSKINQYGPPPRREGQQEAGDTEIASGLQHPVPTQAAPHSDGRARGAIQQQLLHSHQGDGAFLWPTLLTTHFLQPSLSTANLANKGPLAQVDGADTRSPPFLFGHPDLTVKEHISFRLEAEKGL